MPRPSYRSAHAELREARMILASLFEPRCPRCGKPCRDNQALERHRADAHPKVPWDEMGLE